MRRATTRLATAVAALVLLVGTTRAGVIIDIDQVGPDVVATGSGTLDLTGLQLSISARPSVASLLSNVAVIEEGPAPAATVSLDVYDGATGPASFGGGAFRFRFPSSGSGDGFGVAGAAREIFVPHGYHSGDPLSATDTYGSQTFSSLGLTPGAYTYTWGSGGHADFLTVEIGDAAGAAPEPSTLVGGTLGVALALGYARRRRRAGVAA